MIPVLFRIFDYPVSSYAVMMALGYVVALGVLVYVTRTAHADGIPKEALELSQVWDLFIVMVVSSILGSKIGHTLFEAPGHITEDGRRLESLTELLKHDPWHWARLGEGGYVWYGGLLGALFTAVVYFYRRKQLRPWLYADVFAPAIAAGAVVGRLGCFLAGCCHGKPSDVAWAVKFPKLLVPVHPTQLYDASIAFVLMLGLLFWFRRRRFDGQNIAFLLISYSVLRAFTEGFRGDEDRGSVGPLSTSQLISIPLFIVGVVLHVIRAKDGSLVGPADADPSGVASEGSDTVAS